MAKVRVEKLQELMKQEISDIIFHELKDPRIGFVTVTSVACTEDLREAKIYVSVMGDEKKARDIVQMDMVGLMSTNDYFIICSANTATQVRAIADNIEEKMEEAGVSFLHKEGYREGEWVLLDYGDTVAHIFQQDAREYYALERLWGDAALTPYEE